MFEGGYFLLLCQLHVGSWCTTDLQAPPVIGSAGPMLLLAKLVAAYRYHDQGLGTTSHVTAIFLQHSS